MKCFTMTVNCDGNQITEEEFSEFVVCFMFCTFSVRWRPTKKN